MYCILGFLGSVAHRVVYWQSQTVRTDSCYFISSRGFLSLLLYWFFKVFLWITFPYIFNLNLDTILLLLPLMNACLCGVYWCNSFHYQSYFPQCYSSKLHNKKCYHFSLHLYNVSVIVICIRPLWEEHHFIEKYSTLIQVYWSSICKK